MENDEKAFEEFAGDKDAPLTLEPWPPRLDFSLSPDAQIAGSITCAFDWLAPDQRKDLDVFVPRSAANVRVLWGWAENSGSTPLYEGWLDYNTTGNVGEWMHFSGHAAYEAFDAPTPGVFYRINAWNESRDRTRSFRMLALYEPGSGSNQIGQRLFLRRNWNQLFRVLLPAAYTARSLRMIARKINDLGQPGPWIEFYPSGGLVTYYKPYLERPTSSNADRRLWAIHSAAFRVPANYFRVEAYFLIEYLKG